MKKLQDLKQEILDGKINNFYVFYGEDYGIRKHYIDKLSTFFKQTLVLDSCEDVINMTVSKSLFNIKKLVIIYGDMVFPKNSHRVIETFIKRLNDFCVVLVYETPLSNTTLFKDFSEYITYFPVVEKNIAIEFVDSELNLLQTNKEKLAKNCENNYNNILLESDKIKNYAQAKNMTDENAYEELDVKEQLLEDYDEFNVNLFMNDILTGMTKNIPYWVDIVKNKYADKFYYSLTFMFYDLLIAYLIKKYGRQEGGRRAYNYGLPWKRIKDIRDLDIVYDSDVLLDITYSLSKIDIEVKSGRLQKDKVIDYILTFVI